MTAPSHSAEPQRLAYLESIRGLAAVQVVLLHFFSAFWPDLVFESVNHGVAWYVHLSPLYFLYDGHSAVYIFFVLSGYVLSRSFERHLEHPLALILARALRLGLPGRPKSHCVQGLSAASSTPAAAANRRFYTEVCT